MIRMDAIQFDNVLSELWKFFGVPLLNFMCFVIVLGIPLSFYNIAYSEHEEKPIQSGTTQTNSTSLSDDGKNVKLTLNGQELAIEFDGSPVNIKLIPDDEGKPEAKKLFFPSLLNSFSEDFIENPVDRIQSLSFSGLIAFGIFVFFIDQIVRQISNALPSRFFSKIFHTGQIKEIIFDDLSNDLQKKIKKYLEKQNFEFEIDNNIDNIVEHLRESNDFLLLTESLKNERKSIGDRLNYSDTIFSFAKFYLLAGLLSFLISFYFIPHINIFESENLIFSSLMLFSSLLIPLGLAFFAYRLTHRAQTYYQEALSDRISIEITAYNVRETIIEKYGYNQKQSS